MGASSLDEAYLDTISYLCSTTKHEGFVKRMCDLPQGKKIKCSTSQTKHRLFIGNVPRNWLKDDLKKAVTKVGPGVINVDLMKVTSLPPSLSNPINASIILILHCVTGSTEFKP